MGPTRDVIRRAAWRVGASSIGEVIGRAVNLLLPFCLLAQHGADSSMDDFFVALAIAFFFQGTVSNVLVSVLVPRLVAEGVGSIRPFLAWSGAAAVVSGVAAALLGGRVESFAAGSLIPVSVGTMAATGIIAAPAVAALNASHRYAVPGLCWGLRILPLAMYLGHAPDSPALHWLLAGLALADLARTGILLSMTRLWQGMSKRGPRLTFPPAASSLLVSSAIVGLTPLLARWIATFGAEGSASAFEAADRLYSSVAALATIGVGNVLLVYLSRLTGTREEAKGWGMIVKSATAWSALWLAGSLLVWALFPFVHDLLRLELGDVFTDVRHTFLALAVGMPAAILTMVFTRRLLTLEMVSCFVPIALANVSSSVVTILVLFPVLGTPGIGLGLSVGQSLAAMLMIFVIWRRDVHAHPRTC